MGLIDSHAHLTFPEFSENFEQVLERSTQAGVDRWITVGTDPDDSVKSIELANRFENIYATVGYHPHYAKDVTGDDLVTLQQQLAEKKVVALGEIGLDYHYNFSEPQIQKEIFRKQLGIAEKTNMPVIIHSREAFEDTMAILDEFQGKLKDVVIHCFSGDAEQAKIVVAKGYYVSFTGVVTFKNAQTARDAAAQIPLEKLMVETDCPFMSPAPMRKQKVNEPSLMIHTAAKLAEIKNVSKEEFARVTEQTTINFFGLD